VSDDLDLRRALKPVDCWWTVAAVDPVAMRLLPPLLRRRAVTPNRVTGVAFVVGIVAVALLATGHLRAGAVVYEVRFVLDCLDGKIARVRRVSSTFGAVFDRLADAFTVPAAYAAIGWTLAQRGDWSSRWILAVALMATLVTVCELSLEAVRFLAPPATPGSAPAGATSQPQSGAGVLGWMRRHRLTLRPWTVEAETLGLFLGPLVLSGTALADLEWAVAAIYVVFVAVDVSLMARASRASDS
jgi:phosphatidylglycerophosphate synthase